MGLLLALPCILQQMAERFEGRKLKHKVAQKTLSRNIAFQLASLYLLTVSGTIFDSFQEAVLHPLCVGQILGNTIPKLSVCFFTWVVVRISKVKHRHKHNLSTVCADFLDLCWSPLAASPPPPLARSACKRVFWPRSKETRADLPKLILFMQFFPF
ncbi:unnamed protein product [Prorocentrum cordatum]|uniref:CSC1/OSCA1-like 7TM region domain-containing protein n=1 Tax=Prorocentrum cordatum TaxID=2364126 RepID=A0ABN9XIP3_9DINO|nr:unnamed protein product [Polarella glacialis]